MEIVFSIKLLPQSLYTHAYEFLMSVSLNAKTSICLLVSILMYFSAFAGPSYALRAQTPPVLFTANDTPTASVCEYTVEELYVVIDDMVGSMEPNLGAVAHDSIEQMRLRLNQIAESGTFVASAIIGEWVPEPYATLDEKLKALLAGTHSRPDSINTLCHWIASRYPFGDHDPLSDTRSLDSTWHLMNQGNIQGQCSDFSTFFSKIVEQYFAGWGVPIQFQSSADTALSLGGTGDPSHVWVGLAQDNGKIWAVCDPTLGGIVKDSQTDEALSLDDILVALRDQDKSLHVSIQHPASSLQAFGMCVPTVMLVDTESLTYFNTPVEVVEGHWLGLDTPSPLRIPYWLKKGLPRFTFMNVYLDMRHGWSSLSQHALDVAKKVQRLYRIPVND